MITIFIIYLLGAYIALVAIVGRRHGFNKMLESHFGPDYLPQGRKCYFGALLSWLTALAVIMATNEVLPGMSYSWKMDWKLKHF